MDEDEDVEAVLKKITNNDDKSKKKEYKLLDPGDINQNVKTIGDRIVQNIAEEYLKNPQDTPDKIEAQVINDLATVYYEEFGSRIVKPEIKEKICNAWYVALKTRVKNVMKDVVKLLKNEDNMKPADHIQNGGNNSDNEDDLTESEKEKEEKTAKKNAIYFEKLIEYKSKMFAVENFKQRPLRRSATVSQIYEINESIISKILCNYALVKREKLMEQLRKIIIGDDAMKILKEYKISKQWVRPKNTEPSTTSLDPKNIQSDSIYSSFLRKLDKLSDINLYQEKSTPIVRTPAQQKGGDNKIPKHIPSTYIWNNIRGYVETQLQMRIIGNINMNQANTNAIQDAFKIIFSQSNCDSLNLSDKNEKMTEHLNAEYHNILDYLCINIPDKYAAKILQSYLLRNFNEVVAYFDTFLNEDNYSAPIIEVFDSYFLNYSALPPIMFSNADITPVYPKVRRQNVPKDTSDESDKPCDDPKLQSLNSAGVSDFFKMNNIGKEKSIADSVTPMILKPMFDIYKDEFNKCTEDDIFLKTVFDMYSGRCVKFLKQIQLQFEQDIVNDYIERYILTKHLYTTNVISECIKHAAKIKSKLSKKSDSGLEPGPESPASASANNMSKYVVFLMHSASDLAPNINVNDTMPFFEFVKNGLDGFFTNGLLNLGDSAQQIISEINAEIIENIPPQELKEYDGLLKNIFSKNERRIARALKYVNKSIIPKFRGYTQKNRKIEPENNELVADSDNGTVITGSLESQEDSIENANEPLTQQENDIYKLIKTWYDDGYVVPSYKQYDKIYKNSNGVEYLEHYLKTCKTELTDNEKVIEFIPNSSSLEYETNDNVVKIYNFGYDTIKYAITHYSKFSKTKNKDTENFLKKNILENEKKRNDLIIKYFHYINLTLTQRIEYINTLLNKLQTELTLSGPTR